MCVFRDAMNRQAAYPYNAPQDIPGYDEWLNRSLAANPDPIAASSRLYGDGLANDPKVVAMNESMRRRDWLSQEQIDRLDPAPPRRPEALAWLESCPGGWSTLILLVCFVAGCWGAYWLYQLLKTKG